jgi:hypothetical protein
VAAVGVVDRATGVDRPHSTWKAVADGRPVITVSPQAAANAARSWVIVMIRGAGRPSA